MVTFNFRILKAGKEFEDLDKLAVMPYFQILNFAILISKLLNPQVTNVWVATKIACFFALSTLPHALCLPPLPYALYLVNYYEPNLQKFSSSPQLYAFYLRDVKESGNT